MGPWRKERPRAQRPRSVDRKAVAWPSNGHAATVAVLYITVRRNYRYDGYVRRPKSDSEDEQCGVLSYDGRG